MKKITYTIGFAFAMLATSNAVAQQGFGTNRPDKSSAVEIKSPNKGLLIPRITLTSDTDVATIASPANSLLIYNETTTGGLHAGYYYFNQTQGKWIPFTDSLNQNKTTVTQDGQNLSVVPTATPNTTGGTTTDYKVKITPGTDKQFLATEMVGTELQTKWVDYTTIANLITAENGLTKTGNNIIKLGGDLTGDTTIDTKAFDLFIKGLSTTTVMTNKVIAVGDATTGKVEVATPQTIVAAGIDNNLTSAVNDMTSVVNGDTATAKIINTNDLSVAGTVLKSAVNGVEDTQDLKAAIQEGQIKYEVTSTDGSVTIDPAGSTADLKKFDLKVAGTNDNIQVGNGISKEAANNNRVVLGGALDKATEIVTTNAHTLAVKGLTVATDMTNKVIAIGDATSGVLQAATPQTIVAAGISAQNGLKINATNLNQVNLGGPLTEATTITTTSAETLAIAGLQDFTGDQKSIVVLGPGNVLQKASLNTANAIATKNTSYTALLTDETILVDASTASVTITLPAADASNKGKRFYVKKVDASHVNEVIVDSASNIDGDASPLASSNPYQAWLLQSDGVAWFVVGN